MLALVAMIFFIIGAVKFNDFETPYPWVFIGLALLALQAAWGEPFAVTRKRL